MIERSGVFLGNTAFAAALGLALVGIGRLVLRLLRLRFESAAWRNLHALAFGFGAFSFAVYFLGVVGLFGRAVLIALLIFGLAVSVLEVRAVFGELRAGWRGWSDWFRSRETPAMGKLLAAALAGYLGVLFLRCFLPAVHTDPLAYQLTVPQQWLLEERVKLLPTHILSELPAGVWMLYAVGQAVRGFEAGALACKLVDFGFFLASLSALYLGVREFSSARAARWALSAYAATPAVAYYAVLSQAAAPSTFFLILGLVWLARWVKDPGGSYQPVVLAGIMGGLALWCKVHGGVFAAAAGVLVVAGALRAPGKRIRRLATAVSLYALMGTLVAAPWYLRSWLETGNPVFPMASGVFPSEYFSSAQGHIFGASLSGGRDLARPVSFLWEYADYSGDSQWVIGPAWVLLVFLALAGIRRLSSVARWALLVGLFYSVITHYLLHGNIRYANVLVVVLALPAGEGMVLALGWLRKSGTTAFAVGLQLLAVATMIVSAAFVVRIHGWKSLAAQPELTVRCFGRPRAVKEYAEILEGDRPRVLEVPAYEVMLAARQLVPPGQKVLLAGFHKGYHMDRRYLQDTPGQTQIRFDGPGGAERAARALERLGVRYVIWPERGSESYFARHAKSYYGGRMYWEDPEYVRFAERYTEVLHSWREASLRKLKPPAEIP